MAILRRRAKSSLSKLILTAAPGSTTEEVLGLARTADVKMRPLDVSALARLFNIRVRSIPLENDTSGYLEEGAEGWGIFVNALHHPRRQRFTVAHELGHFFLHKDRKKKFIDKKLFRNGESNQIETQANKFAADLLMPEIDFKEYVTNSSSKVEFIAEYFGVSAMAVRVRASELGYVGHNL